MQSSGGGGCCIQSAAFQGCTTHSAKFSGALHTECRVQLSSAAAYLCIPHSHLTFTPLQLWPLHATSLPLPPTSPSLLKSFTIFHMSYLCCCIKLKHPVGSSTSPHTIGGSFLICREMIQWGSWDLLCTCIFLGHSGDQICGIHWETNCKHRNRTSMFTSNSGEQGAEGLSQRWWDWVPPSSSWKKALLLVMDSTIHGEGMYIYNNPDSQSITSIVVHSIVHKCEALLVRRGYKGVNCTCFQRQLNESKRKL